MEAGLPSGRSLLSDRITPPVHTTVLPDSSGESTLPAPTQAGKHAGKRAARCATPSQSQTRCPLPHASKAARCLTIAASWAEITQSESARA